MSVAFDGEQLEQLSEEQLRESMAGIDPDNGDFRRILSEETAKAEGEVKARAWQEYQGELRKEFEAAVKAANVRPGDTLNYYRVKAPFIERGLDKPMPKKGLAVTDQAAEVYSQKAVVNAANRVKRQQADDAQAALRREFEAEVAPHRGNVNMIYQIRARYQARGLKFGK